MHNIIKTSLFLAILTLGLSSCNTSKTVLPYFSDIVEIAEGTIPPTDYIPIIQPDDELYISVSAEYPEAAAEYNLPFVNPAMRDAITQQTNPRTPTYIVNEHGDIDFPVLGTLHVAGMTTEELKNKLVADISKNVKDPIVMVRLTNFTIIVAGEVRSPKPVKVNRSRITILDALAEAGDLTEYGERSNVLVIREEEGVRKFAHLNLNSSEILTSPYFYLKQNDYVYVAPNKVRQANSKYNQNNSFKLSLASTITSAISVAVSAIAVALR